MPKPLKILRYWHTRYEELGPVDLHHDGVKFEFSMDVEKSCCFACNNPTLLDRCHIVPLINGGNNDVSNLHLLCRGCHVESENSKFYWTWMKNKRLKYWKPKWKHIVNRMELNGLDVDKEANYLESLNLPWEEYLNHVRIIMEKYI